MARNHRKNPQPLAIPRDAPPWLQPFLHSVREVLFQHERLIGSGQGDDVPVKKVELEALVKRYAGLAIDYPPVPQVRIDEARTLDNGAQLRFDGRSFSYKGHSHIEVARSADAERVGKAVYVGRAEAGGVFNDYSGEPNTWYRYYARNVNVTGDKGPWAVNAGTRIRTGAVNVRDIEGIDAYVEDTVAPTLLAVVDAKKSWVGVNVNDWNTYFAGEAPAFALGVQVKLDAENDELYVKFENYDAGADDQAVKFELEVIGATITGYTNISLEAGEEPTDKGADIDFVDDTGNQYGPNGIIIRDGWSVDGATSDEAKWSLSELNEAVVLRLKVTSITAATNYFISLGDMMADRDAPMPIEYWFTAADASAFDVLRMENAPAEAGAERTTGANTSVLVDNAGLGESAAWAAVDGIPDTLNEHGITDGQTDLGPSTDDRQVLHRDLDGDPYWATKLDLGESNMGSFRPLAGNTPVPYHSTNFTRLGNVIVLANPGRAVTLKVDVHILAVMNSGDSARVAIKPWISVDGGVTEVTTGGGADPDDPSVAYPTAKSGQTCASTAFVWQGTPTGDIHIGMQGRQVDNVGSVGLREQTVVSFIVGPNSEYSIVVGELVATVPSARSGSCSKHFTSGTTCNAAATVTASVTGGTPDYSYAWAKVSGTDSITSGTTSKTCTVSGTHTTADPSAVHQTTVKCTVTDDAAEVASSGNCVVSLSYKRTYSDVFVSTPDKNFGCSVRVGQFCTSEGELSRTAGGGDGDYDDSWTKVSGEGSIVSGATTSSPLVRHTDTATEPATTYVGLFKDTVTDGRGDSASDNAQVNFTHTGF